MAEDRRPEERDWQRQWLLDQVALEAADLVEERERQRSRDPEYSEYKKGFREGLMLGFAKTGMTDATTDANGVATFTYTSNAPGTDTVRACSETGGTENDICDGTEPNDTAEVTWGTSLPKVDVTARAGRSSVERGSNVGIVGAVEPSHAGTEVVLQRSRDGGWRPVASDDLNARSRYRFVIEAGWRGRRTFRVLWRAQDGDHAANSSRNVVIRTMRP